MTEFGYIYIRHHESYDKYNACKLGKASNIKNRETTYITGEINKGKYLLVIEFSKGKEIIIEKYLEINFKSKGYHIYINGGTEFYNIKIIDLIIPFLNESKLKYRILSQTEINNLNRLTYKNNYNLAKKIIQYTNDNIFPKEHQIPILDIIEDFYNNNNIGKLIWSCGLGKTLLSIFIIQKLKLNKILIGVPSVYLQKQFIKEIFRIFPNKKILCVGGDTEYSTDNISEIYSFYNKYDNSFIITTYASCYKLLEKTFDFKIGDEAHHLTGIENSETNNYKLFHEIKSNKTLFMTATEKMIDNNKDNIYTMDDEETFGRLVDSKSVQWAIENKKITDYNLLILSNTENEINSIISELNIKVDNKDLFLSAFMSLKAIEKYNDLTHVLICCNSTDNSDLIYNYINEILKKKILNIDINSFYNNSLHSKKNMNMENEIYKFKNSNYGIICSVYIFGEGFDLPKLNCVVFAENMISDIRIVQTSLRPNRLEEGNKTKKAYIIIPYMESCNIITDYDSFNRVRMIISKLRNVDETIEQKIKIQKICKSFGTNKKDPEHLYYFEDDNQELSKIKLRLKYSKALNSKNTEEEDEYNYVKLINKELNIQSKEDYGNINIKEVHHNYIENAEEYFKLNGVWHNWYDFLGVDTSKFIQSKEEWIKFCKENNIKSLDNYYKLCDKYECLPRNPHDFYYNFSNILSELNINKKRR
jgi:predicted helicase